MTPPKNREPHPKNSTTTTSYPNTLNQKIRAISPKTLALLLEHRHSGRAPRVTAPGSQVPVALWLDGASRSEGTSRLAAVDVRSPACKSRKSLPRWTRPPHRCRLRLSHSPDQSEAGNYQRRRCMPKKYEAIRDSEERRGKSPKVARRIAAATYNKQRKPGQRPVTGRSDRRKSK